MTEPDVKNLFKNKDFVSKVLSDYFHYHLDFIVQHEIELENGITMDHLISDSDGAAILLVESKGGDIGITEFLRGVGQTVQYQHHIDKKIKLKYSKNCKTLLAFPDELYSKIDIDKIIFGDNVLLLVINSSNNSAKVVDPAKIKGLFSAHQNIVTISPYYIRDNKLGELYVSLLETRKRMGASSTRVSRDFTSLLESIGAPNPGNARNIGISLASLGFVDSFNALTSSGFEFSKMDYSTFVTNIVEDYIYPYTNAIFYALFQISIRESGNNNIIINASWEQINDEIRKNWNGQDVMYLTESGNRYMSSWFGILKDDLQCVEFTSGARGSKPIKIKYFPLKGLPNFSTLQTRGLPLFIPDYVQKYLDLNR